MGPLEPAPYFQTASLIIIQIIDKGRRWKGRLLLVSHLLGDMLGLMDKEAKLSHQP